jgi:hypothetical protein
MQKAWDNLRAELTRIVFDVPWLMDVLRCVRSSRWPVVTVLLAALSSAACGGHPAQVATPTKQATVPRPSPSPAPPCQSTGDDVQPVRFDIDERFVATHPASDVIDPVWWSGDIDGTVARYEYCLAPFSREQRLMYALTWYQGEVDNGGHHQLFWNSTGIVFPDALSAVQEMGLSEGVAIMTEAKQRLGGEPSRDRSERQEQLHGHDPEQFQDLDNRFYELERDGAFDKAMTAYIRAHAPAFFFHGTVLIPTMTLELKKRLLQNLKPAR